MNIALYARNTLANKPEYVISIYEKLKINHVQLFIYKPYYEFLLKQFQMTLDLPTIHSTQDLQNNQIDLILSLGGDGTILETLVLIQKLNIPVFGINTGRLGFLTYDFNQNIQNAVDLILQKEYTIQKRSLLELIYPSHQVQDINFALNEIVIHKKDNSSMLYIDIFIDDTYLTNIFSDGVIISTATGSTAYSLSCGGPILEPEVDAMIITPIASHSLNARPIVISSKHKLSFKIDGRNPQYTLSLDARTYDIDIHFNQELIQVGRASHHFHLVVPHPYHFFDSLRNKLYWGNDKRF